MGQNLARYIAVNTPMGTPTTIAPAVMYKDPRIIGNIPKEGGISLGDQFLPSKNLNTPISAMAGKPFANMKKHIRITEIIDAQAERKNTISINFSKGLAFILSPTLFAYLIPFYNVTNKNGLYLSS